MLTELAAGVGDGLGVAPGPGLGVGVGAGVDAPSPPQPAMVSKAAAAAMVMAVLCRRTDGKVKKNRAGESSVKLALTFMVNHPCYESLRGTEILSLRPALLQGVETLLCGEMQQLWAEMGSSLGLSKDFVHKGAGKGCVKRSIRLARGWDELPREWNLSQPC